MQRFTNILAYVDLGLAEHPALLCGMRLAERNQARLTALTVIEEHPAQAHAVLRSLHLENALENIERERLLQLEQLVEPLRAQGLEVETMVAHGSPFVEIIRAALRRRHDLVIKTVASEGLLHRTFFGSTDMHLLRKCPTPLWLIKPGVPAEFRRILVPLDPNLEDGIRYDLGMNLLTLATSLADLEGAELAIVHAWHAYEQERLRTRLDPQGFAEYVRAWGQECSNRTWRFISAFGQALKPKSIHLVQGEPGFVIPKFAKEHEIDLVVMGTLGRLGQHGMFISDTAERILNRLECSVLAVKPAGFVSPVT